jgi:hypothetical protein
MWLTEEATAAVLQRSVPELRALCTAQKIKSKRIDGTRHYDPADVDRLFDAQRDVAREYTFGWTAEEFLKRHLPPKQSLIQGLLSSRDLTTLVGRRRHGKSIFLLNMGVALAVPASTFLGYAVVRPARSLLLLLEDDPTELQEKLCNIMAGRSDESRLVLLTREDFHDRDVRIDVHSQKFWESISEIAEQHQPEFIAFDNYAHVVGGNFNDAKIAHTFVDHLYYKLAKRFNASVAIATHPRKRDAKNIVSLEDDPEQFYEESLGSSHLINSTGNLWGLHRNEDSYSVFHGGRQRADGYAGFTLFEKDDNDQLNVITGSDHAMQLVLTTEARRGAWASLPASFGYREGEKAVKPHLKSTKSFHDLLNDLKRHELVKQSRDSRYHKAV